MYYQFTFWFRQTLGYVQVSPAGAVIVYNGQCIDVDHADHDLSTAVFTARMQARPLRTDKRAVIKGW